MIAKIPYLVKKYYPNLIWEIKTEKQEVFITFDDGPIPDVTPWVLETLKKYQAKATFFCIGENVEKHPEIYQKIIDEGHAVGNHTYNHIKGWEHNDSYYLNNSLKASQLIDSKFFRPPYGRIKKSQIKLLKENNFEIVMWSSLSGDYNKNRSALQCFKNIKNTLKSGSIIVFHDSKKAENNMKIALIKTLEYLKNEGYGTALIN